MNISRRTILKSSAGALVLPYLNANAESGNTTNPLRAVFLGIGYGVTEDKWFPKEDHNKYKITPGLKPLEKNRNNFSVIQNLSTNAGPHDGSSNFLTTNNVESIDQVIAEKIGLGTRYQSIEITTEGSTNGHGKLSSLAKDKQGLSLPGDDHLALFYKLFASSNTDIHKIRQNLANEKSMLDGMLIQIKSINKNIGKDDKEILAQYYSSIRDLEKRIARAEKWLKVPLPKAQMKTPEKKLKASEELKLIYDLIVIAMKSDQSRVFSVMQKIQSILVEVADGLGSHAMSHYKQDSTKVGEAGSLKRDIFNSEMLNYFIDKLKTTKETGGRSLLDNSMVAFGTPVRSGHNTKNGVMILAGRAGGKIKQGQNIVYKKDSTNLSNLWFSMLKQVAPQEKGFSDSQRYMSELFLA